MTKSFKTAQGICITKFRFKNNRRAQVFEESTLARNPEFVGKIAFDASDKLEGDFI